MFDGWVVWPQICRSHRPAYEGGGTIRLCRCIGATWDARQMKNSGSAKAKYRSFQFVAQVT